MLRPPPRSRSVRSRQSAAEALLDLLERHAGIALILALSVMARLILSDLTSYRLDELYSVKAYGTDHASLYEALRALAERSVHPPLFQAVLYYWVKLFGVAELATRLLSNLYAAGATLLLYLFSHRVFGLRVAVLASLLVAISDTVFRWGLDTRSYAQSLFLSTLSTYFLLGFLERLREQRSWRGFWRNGAALRLGLANVALLFTHYYNVFFLAAQGLFLLGFFALEDGRRRFPGHAAKVVLFYGAQLALLMAGWGWVMRYTLRSYQGSPFSVDAPSAGPVELFHRMVSGALLGESAWVTVFSSALLAALAITAFRAWRPRSPLALEHHAALYLVLTAAGPCFAAYLVFWLGHAERYHARYFGFSTAPLLLALVVALDRGLRLPELRGRRRSLLDCMRPLARGGAALAMGLLLLAAAARGFEGGSLRKGNFRPVAEEISHVVRGDAEHRYLIYEASSYPFSMLDFYLERMHPAMKAFGTILSSEELSGQFRFEARDAEIRAYDFLILAFPHKKWIDFPNTIQRLGQKYLLHARHVDEKGFGYIVFRVRPAR